MRGLVVARQQNVPEGFKPAGRAALRTDSGEPGQVGRNPVVRTNGREETLASQARTELIAGDLLIEETPGRGGFMSANNDR